MAFTNTATMTSFGGRLLKLTHESATTSCTMAVNLYLPPQAESSKVPVLFYLAGLTCTGDNCAEKGNSHGPAAKKGIAIVYPDTSPRGLKIPGEDDAYDFGSGAGFYVDATQEPWSKGYKMYSYITEELPKTLFANFKELDENRTGIFGHSMGGHGALTIYLKNPGKYKSVSAFAPICNPCQCPWGEKAFSGYFGKDAREMWRQHDATELIKKHKGPLDILIDVGTRDQFYQQRQLLPENLAAAAKEAGNNAGINIRYNAGYDHSYYTIATFMEDHIEHAAKHL